MEYLFGGDVQRGISDDTEHGLLLAISPSSRSMPSAWVKKLESNGIAIPSSEGVDERLVCAGVMPMAGDSCMGTFSLINVAHGALGTLLLSMLDGPICGSSSAFKRAKRR